MKKNRFNVFIAILALAVFTFTFVACGKDNPTPSAPKYTITLEQTDDYTLEADKSSSESFEYVNVTVNLLDFDKKVIGVKYNNDYASKKSDGTFTFLMPAKNVVVSVVLEDYLEQLTSDTTSRPFMTFSSANVKTLVPNSGDFSMYIATNGSYMSRIRSEIASSNQSVIPDDAFSITNKCSSGSNLIIGTNIIVDTSKISKGTTWLTVSFVNDNVSSQKGTIVVKLTVDSSIDVDVWTETLTFKIDSKDASTSTFEITVSNLDYQPGMPEELDHQSFKNLQVKDGKITVEIKYVSGQTFMIGLFKYVDGQSNFVEMKLLESVEEGSTPTGFNQYKNGILTFIRNGASLTITAQDK